MKSFISSLFYFMLVLPCYSFFTLHKADNPDLSNNAILSMYQDRNGYMWFGTYDGLNLYNGKHTSVYRFESGNKYSLCSNIIQKITQADDDNLWVSTSLGLNKFSLKERRVTEAYTEYPTARLLAVDKQGNTCVISKRDYISYYNPKQKTFRDIYLPALDPNNVKALFFDKNDILYIITFVGKLINVDLSSDKEMPFNESLFHPKSVTNAFVKDSEVYFLDIEKKMYTYNISDKRKSFLCDFSSIINKYGEISDIEPFRDSLFVSFRSNGVIKLDKKNIDNPKSMNMGIGVFCLLKDSRQDILWIGTDGQGVQMYYQNHAMFGNILFNNLPFDLQKPVRAIYTDEYNNLWIGTKGNGIIKINNYSEYDTGKMQGAVERYDTTNGLSNSLVFCFLKSKYRNIIWIGTNGPGFSYYSYKDKKVRTLPSMTEYQIAKVHSICEINDSTLWMATAGNGLLEVTIKEENDRLTVKSVNAFFLKKNNKICNEFHSMSYDGKSTLFVGSRGGYGVARFDVITKKYEFLQISKTDNSAIGDVLSVYQSKDSVFYFGASSGMTRMQFFPDGYSNVKQFDRRNGIANDMIHGILEDVDGCIWLSTNKGLAKYNPHNDFFHNYSNQDLKVTEYSDDAYWKCPHTNRLFFGGINGLIWVEPQKNRPTDYKPDLYFYDLKISGVPISLYDYMNPENGHLELPYDANSFTVSFVAIDYINGENYEYSYMLENYNSGWTELQKTNEVTFTNLPYGDYVLKVKYKNDVLDSDEKFYLLHITILPPWYLSNWAILLYLIFSVALIAVIIYQTRQKIIKRQALIARKIREEQKEKLLEAKLNFFTNITHELCTPLTLINGVNEHIQKIADTNNNLKKYSGVLHNNVNSLNELIKEILDFRKIEESEFGTPVIKYLCVAKLMKRQLELFVLIAEQNNIDFQVSITDDLFWNTDALYFNRIFSNLLSNAFKYTHKGGEVKIMAEADSKHLIIKVYNTGQGIKESEIPLIFDRYRILETIENDNSYSQMASRNGIGLSVCHSLIRSLKGNIEVKSEVNKYVEFIVTLPILQETELKDDSIEADIMPVTILPSDYLNYDSALVDEAQKPLVLVVDDNKDIVWLIREALSDRYTIKEAYSGEEALKIVEEQTPVLIITDIIMSDINGLELITHIKANKFMRHIPLIIVSAKISDKEQAEGLNVGADAYLTKPFSPLVLCSTVNRLLATKHELKDYYYSPESAYEYTDGQLIHQEDKDFMNKVTSLIEANIESENLRPEIIAEKLGMSTRSLYRKFKKVTGLSPNDFIKDYRFTCAARLLVTSGLTIQEVIYKVGITNKSYFYREFLKKYNKTPAEYRSTR